SRRFSTPSSWTRPAAWRSRGRDPSRTRGTGARLPRREPRRRHRSRALAAGPERYAGPSRSRRRGLGRHLGRGDSAGARAWWRRDRVRVPPERRDGADWTVVRLAGDTGVERWRHVVDGAAHGSDLAEAVALDASGDLLVAGTLQAAA